MSEPGDIVPARDVPSLAEQVALVPTDPGCYLWKDAKGEVVYVGKAKNLRARMRQYVTLQDDREKIPLMMQVVKSFDYVVVGSEHEALVLERNLIAQYHPYFNVDYKDDKSYPFIAITESDVFPAIKYTREKHRKGTRYFGPYTDARGARDHRHPAQGGPHLHGNLRGVEARPSHSRARARPGGRGQHAALQALPPLL